MIDILSKANNFGVKFPTNIKELTPDILKSITDGIKLPKYYCIVALAFDTKLFDFCTILRNSKNTNVGVIPILAKISEDDSKEINASIGDRLIIDRSNLERGVQLNVKTMITSNNASRFFSNDNELTKNIIQKSNIKIGIDCETGADITANTNANIIVIEFKICPINAISAAIPMNAKVIDPFKSVANSCS